MSAFLREMDTRKYPFLWFEVFSTTKDDAGNYAMGASCDERGNSSSSLQGHQLIDCPCGGYRSGCINLSVTSAFLGEMDTRKYPFLWFEQLSAPDALRASAHLTIGVSRDEDIKSLIVLVCGLPKVVEACDAYLYVVVAGLAV